MGNGYATAALLKIDGTPAAYTSGRSYPMMVVITQPSRLRQGVQLSARFTQTGEQAGRLVPLAAETQIREVEGVQYLTHTIAGSGTGVDLPLEIRFDWVAPDPVGGPVHFIVAGHADDRSGVAGGDYILAAAGFSSPAQEITEITEVTEIEPTQVTPAARLQETSKAANLPSPMDLDKGSFEMQIQHRFFQSIEGPGTAFGIDFGANINLGMNYAITDRLSAGVARTRVDQIIAFTGTYEINTNAESLWNLSLLGGIEGQENFKNHYSPFAQAAASFDYKIIRLNVVPTIVFNSRRDALLRPGAINPDSNHTLSLGLGTDIALHPRFSLTGEYVPRLAGFGGFDKRRPQLSGGIAIRTWGHVFSVMLSTSRDFTPAKYAVNAESRDFSLGFNIYRKIR
jgi:hypothetical protein